MKKSKITDSEIRLIVILVAMALLAVAYFFGYNMCMRKAVAIEAENEAERVEIARLQGMVAQRETIEKETEQMHQIVRDIIAKYPVEVPTEKAVYLLQQMEDKTNVHFKNINFAMVNLVSTVDAADGTTSLGCYGNLTLAYEAAYEDLKEMVSYIENFDDRTNLPSIAVAYDESTGLLSGAVNIKMYFLTNTEKEYEEIPNLGIQSGVDCIFGGTGLNPEQEEAPAETTAENEGE